MDIESIKAQINSDIENVSSAQDLEEFRIKYLGRKGIIAQLTATIPGLPIEQRAGFGQQVNSLKNTLLSLIDEKQKSISSIQHEEQSGAAEIDLPGIAQELGRLHPITQIIDEICTIFNRMAFSVVEGPEIET
jgi:phenylalanyl-tRNA synthetase alpha chain